jgi:hypothetical protein
MKSYLEVEYKRELTPEESKIINDLFKDYDCYLKGNKWHYGGNDIQIDWSYLLTLLHELEDEHRDTCKLFKKCFLHSNENCDVIEN